ncbi:MAG: hypothetical protein Q9200_002481 [Gallowayella weberi]
MYVKYQRVLQLLRQRSGQIIVDILFRVFVAIACLLPCGLSTRDLHRSQEDLCPLILDDSYDPSDIDGSDVGWNSTEGLLDEADRKTVGLSMSGYGNQPATDYTASEALQVDNHGFVYGETRPLSNTQGFVPYEQQGHVDAPTQFLPEEYDQGQYQLAYSTNNLYHPRPLYGVTQTAMPEPNMQKAPIVTSWGPEQGSPGTLINVDLHSNYDLALLSTAKATMRFADIDCPATLKRLDDPKKSTYQYVLISRVPMLDLAELSSSQVRISVQLQDLSGMTVTMIDVGYFRYNSRHRTGIGSPQGVTQQQSLIMNMTKTYDPAGNEAVAQARSQSSTPGFYRTGRSPYAQRSRPQTQDSSPRYSPYELPSSSSRRRSSTILSESGCPTMDLTPQGSGWTSSYAANNRYGQRTALSVTPALRMQSSLVPPVVFEPPLFRTSERLKELNKNMPATSPKITKVPHSVEARLEIHGKVDSMMDGWTPDECKAQRRLVHFWRSQRENTVFTSFAPWVPEARVPKEQCRSCIWWEERQDCFATSVDVIRLCEQLVARGGNVTTPEKNRIRRNVSNFAPITIHKDDPETQDFFALIMGYTNPKPKNIQKAIKVLPWRNIGPAMMKLVKKYVSPSSYLLEPPKGTITDNGITVCRLLQRTTPSLFRRTSQERSLRTHLPTLQFPRHFEQ